MVATFGASDGASDRSDRRHAAARRALGHRRRGRGDRRRAARARGRSRPRSVHTQHPRAPAPRRGSARHALRADSGAHPAAIVGARRRAAHRSLVAAGRVVHATNYLAPPSRLPTLVSVYDCSFVRYPELCTPEVRAFDPVIRRAVARGATLHTGSEFVADEIEEIFGGGLRARGPARRDPARRPAARRRGRDAARRSRPRSAARRSSSRSARSSPARTSRTSSARSASSRRAHPDLRLVIAGHDGPARPEIDAAIARLPAGARERVVLAGRGLRRGPARAAGDATAARVPVDLRRLRLPGARGDDRGRAGRRGARRVDPRGRGRRRAPRRTDERAGARRRRWTACITDDATRAELIARGRDRVHAFSWDHTARALASCYRRHRGGAASSEGRGARRSAAATGARAASVATRSRCCATCPSSASSRSRSRPATRPRGVAPRVPWIDLGPPHGSVRYELWHRLRRPIVRIEADVVHAPSLAVPPVRDRPLVVTVHDVAFRRLPGRRRRSAASASTRAGSTLARRHASLVIVPSEFTGDELEREGFERDRIAVVPFGVDPPVPRDPDEIDRAVARAGVQPPYVLTVGTVEPRKDLPTIVRAVEQLRRDASRPHARRRRAARLGRGDAGSTVRSCRSIGAQPWSVLDALYRRADAFCLASLYEGFGLPVVEAMARGVPTVATTGSALEEVVQGAGALFAPGDVDGVRATDRTRARRRRAARRARRAPAWPGPRELNWDRMRRGPRRAYARGPHAPVFVDSARARAARRLGRSRPPGRRRRLHDRDRARHRGARRRRPASADPPRRHRPLGRARARRRRCTRSRRTAGRPRLGVGAGRGPAGRAARSGPTSGTGRTTRCRCARRCPTVVAMHDLTFFDHPEWHERSKVVYFRRMIARRGARAPTSIVTGSHDAADGLRARFRLRRRDRRRASRRRPRALRAGRRRRRPTSPRSPRTASRSPYIAFASTIEPRKDVPDARARVRAHRAPRIPTCSSSSRAATAGASPRRAPRSRRAASRRASCAPATSTTRRSPRCSAGPRSSRTRRWSRASACPRSKRSRAARRSSRPRDRRSRRSSATPRCSSRPPTPTPSPARWRPCSTTRTSRPGCAPRARRAPRRSRGNARSTRTSTRTAARSAPRPTGARRARMKALVTGATGFVGPHLIAHLAGVRRRRRACPATRAARSTSPIAPRCTTCSTPHRPEVVYHLAALVGRRRVVARPDRVPARQRRGHRERARRGARVRARGACSSSGAPRSTARSTPTARASREDAPLRPITPYGASKVAASFLALQAWLGRGLETVRVRAFSHTGAGQSDRFVVPALARRIVEAERDGGDRRSRRQPSTRCATSPTSATSCARTGCCGARRAGRGVQRVQRRRACRSARSRTGWSPAAGGASTSWSTPRSSGRSTFRASSVIRPSSSRRPAGRPSTRSTTRSTPCSPTHARALRVPDGRATEQRRDRAGVVAQAVRTVRHDPQVDAVAARAREAARVVDRDDVVGAAVHEQPRSRRDRARRPRPDRGSRSRGSTPRGRSGSRACATRRCGARTRGTTRARAPTCAATRARRTSRCRARVRRRRRRRSRACRRGGSPRSTRR